MLPKLFILAIFCILLYKFAFSNNYRFNIRESKQISTTLAPPFIANQYGKYGFVDENIKTVIPPQFDEATDFNEGLSLVRIDSKYTFIDRAGKQAVTYWFDFAMPFIEEQALVSVGNKYSFIDKKGETTILLKKEVEYAYPFYRDLSAVYINGKWGFIDKQGKIVIKPQFDKVGGFIENLIVVKQNDRFFLINTVNQQVLPQEFDAVKGAYRPKYYFKQFREKIIYDSRYGNFGYPGSENHINNPRIAELTRELNNQWIIVEHSGKQGFIDLSGNIVIKPQFDSILPFFKNIAGVKINDRWGFIDRQGNLVIEPQFDEITGYAGELIVVKLGKRYGLIDPIYNRVASAPLFEDIIHIKHDDYLNDLKEKMIDEVPHTFPYLVNNLIIVKSGEKYGFANQQGEVVIKPQFEQAVALSKEFFLVKTEFKYLIVDNQANILTTLKSNNLSKSFSGRAIALGESGKLLKSDDIYNYQRLEKTINIVEVDPEFQDADEKYIIYSLFEANKIISFNEGFSVVGANDTYAYIHITGKIATQFTEASSLFAIDGSYNSNISNLENSDIEIEPGNLHFYKGLAAIQTIDGKLGFINRSGKVVIETEFDRILGYVKGITVLGSFNRHDSSQFGFTSINGLIDSEQQKVIQTPFKIVNNRSISEFTGTAENSNDYFDLIPVVDDDKGKLGFIDRKGKVIISPIFDYHLQYSYGSACNRRYSGLSIDGEPVIFDCKNRKIIKHKFDAVGNFHEGRAKVRLGNKTNMSNASK